MKLYWRLCYLEETDCLYESILPSMLFRWKQIVYMKLYCRLCYLMETDCLYEIILASMLFGGNRLSI